MANIGAGNFDLVIEEMSITGNPVTKQVLVIMVGKGIGKFGVLLEGAEMQVIQDEGIIEFWKTEIQKEIPK